MTHQICEGTQGLDSVNMLCLCLYTYFVPSKATTTHDTKQKEYKVVFRKHIDFLPSSLKVTLKQV